MQDNDIAIAKEELACIEMRFCSGMVTDADVGNLIRSCRIYRRVIRLLLEKFKREPLRRSSVAEPILNSELAYMREISAVED